MRMFVALGLVVLSGALLFQSGMNVYRSLNSKKVYESRVVELGRIEGKNCPLFYPKD